MVLVRIVLVGTVISKIPYYASIPGRRGQLKQARNERALLLLSLLDVCSAPSDAPLTTSRVAGQRLHSPGDQMMLAVHAATAAPQQPAGLYRTICDTAHRPLTWLAQGTTGTHSAFALKCSLGDPAFHWHETCNTK